MVTHKYAGVDLVIYHKLFILPKAKPVPQKMNVEPFRVLNDEVDRLLKAGFIRETLYIDWLTNPILVRKKMGSEESALTLPT